MVVTTIFAYGTNRPELSEWESKAKEYCEKAGANFRGPIKYKPIPGQYAEEHLYPDQVEEDIGGWLVDLGLSSKERDALADALGEFDQHHAIFARHLEIEGDSAVQNVLGIPTGEGLFVRALMDKSQLPESRGFAPFGYNPNDDYVTDVDYDANHRD